MSDVHAVVTGPIKGTVTCSDGVVFDVKPDTLYVESHERALEIADLIGKRYAAEGHPSHEFGDPFEYKGLSEPQVAEESA